jgi:large subunit ribosomal protein L18
MGKKNKKKKLQGTNQRPRLSVFRSNKYIYAQAIDDLSGYTLAACSSLDKEIKIELQSLQPIEASKKIGLTIAKRLLAKKINNVIFDKSNKPYHGNIKALADGAREGGLEF